MARRDTRGWALAVAGLVSLGLAVAPQALVAIFDVVLPGDAARALGPAVIAAGGATVAIRAGNELRESDVIGDRARLVAAITGGLALVIGLPLALLGLLAA